ncbi:site-specific DNA-methyltransferase [Streptomyces sp. NPDC056399]|uniref:site-specific DNA-methyltransferase n=1 Tax=Streptomyces sp. NPDC056399 TaxID=3345807 RepID=UPI0035E31503
MPLDFEPIDDETGPGETKSNLDLLARLFPDAVVDGTVDIDALRDLLGDDAAPSSAEAFGLRWPGMAEARRLSTLPATGTLLPKPEESVGWDTTRNIVVEGDNLEVLRLLRRGYTNKVDVIYIDPPYNTGNDFVYDDKRTTSRAEHETAAGQRDDEGALQVGEDSDRAQDRRAGASKHAAWLSMMYPRLLVSHHLLSETGVIVVAIDDTEHARLKLLMDRVFGAENFIANIIWQGGRKNDSRYISVGHDYMLIYAKNEGVLRQAETRWREKKPGVDEILARASQIWLSHEDKAVANEAYKKFLKGMAKKGATAGVLRFSNLDESTGRPYNADRDLSAPNLRASGDYDIYHPVTKKAVTRPQGGSGWRMTEESAHRMMEEGLIVFGEDETKVPRGKIFLDEMSDQVAESVFNQERTTAGKALVNLLGEDIFPFPKDTNVVARWLNIVTGNNPDALILDFFAGSGTTGHAVMNLNAADGGSRRYILVQLDEPVSTDSFRSIADITRERLRRAGGKIASSETLDTGNIDTGFRSYHLASSNVRAWDGTPDQLDLLGSVDNLVAGRTTDDLLVEMMLRLGVDLTTPLETREVAGSTLYNLTGTLFAYFGTDITVERASEVAKVLVAWRDEDPGDADTTVVVRDTGFVDSAAKLNFAAAVEQAGFTTVRSI